MSKRLSSHVAKRYRTSSCTPKKKVGERERERERERESITRASISSFRRRIREELLHYFVSIRKKYNFSKTKNQDYAEQRAFELLWQSVCTLREDHVEEELFDFLERL